MDTKFVFYIENIKKILKKYFEKSEAKLKIITNNENIKDGYLADKSILFSYQIGDDKTKLAMMLFLETDHTYTSAEKFTNIVQIYNNMKVDYLLVVSRYGFSNEIKQYVENYFQHKIHLLEGDFLQQRYFDDEIKKIDANFRDVKTIIIRNDVVDFSEDLTYDEMEKVKTFFSSLDKNFTGTFYLTDKNGDKISIQDYAIVHLNALDENNDIKYGSIDLSKSEVFINLPGNVKKQIDKIYVYYYINYGLNLEEAFTSLFINLVTSTLSNDFIINKNFQILAPRQKLNLLLEENDKNSYDLFLTKKLNSIQNEVLKASNFSKTNEDILKDTFEELKNVYAGNSAIKDKFSRILNTIEQIDDKLRQKFLGNNLQIPENINNILDNSINKKTTPSSKKTLLKKTNITDKVIEKNVVAKETKAKANVSIKKVSKKTNVKNTAKIVDEPMVKKVATIKEDISKTPVKKVVTKVVAKKPSKATGKGN